MRLRTITSVLTAIILAICVADAPAASKAKESVPGVIIDHSPASSGRYVGSPSLAVLPDGTYVASHDFFGP